MTHRFPIKEIAAQSGLSTATIDRALNDRVHVSPQTKARVQAAISELEQQEQQLSAKGRRLFIDFVIEAPKRFSDEVRKACESVLSDVGAAAFRPRFHTQEIMSEETLLAALKRFQKRGSHGLCIKARDSLNVARAVSELSAKGIPVFTLVTDIQQADRQGYIGLDNAHAGQTAAFLMARSIKADTGKILTTVSRDDFRGEADRLTGFRDKLAQLKPGLDLIDLSGGAGLFANTVKRLTPTITAQDNIVGIYSMGGANKAILLELPANVRDNAVYVAHDLDRDNLELLQNGQLDFVVYHDLKDDMRRLLNGFAAFYRLAPPISYFASSDIHVITPYNIPSGYL